MIADTVFNHKAHGDELEKIPVRKVNPGNRTEFISGQWKSKHGQNSIFREGTKNILSSFGTFTAFQGSIGQKVLKRQQYSKF